MSTLSPALETALSTRAAVVAVVALKVELPSATLRLLDGASALTIAGETYLGRDPTFGTLSAIEPISDGVDNEAPTLNFVILPPSNTAMATLASPEAQGSTVTLFFVAVEPTTGQVIGDPVTLFIGSLDQATNKVGKTTKAVQISCVSVFEAFFAGDEGARLNNAFHQSIWPGETGFEFVSAVTSRPPWGSDAPRVVLTPNLARY